jgi:hypothetical protein
VITEVVGDQGVQPGQPSHPFWQPPAGQHPTYFVHHLHVVMGLGTVVTHEQHQRRLLQSRPDGEPWRRPAAT